MIRGTTTNPLCYNHNNEFEAESQYTLSKSPLVAELENIFSVIPYHCILKAIESEKIRAFSPLGRHGYPLESLLRGIIASYYLNLGSTAAIVRRLQEDPILAVTCGFHPGKIPHRSTFSRLFSKLKKYQGLVDDCLNQLSSELKKNLPDFGKEIAVDSTPVRTYSNKKKEPLSDLEAGWIVKGSAGAKKDWHFGYKLHLVADANYELPLYKEFTFAKVSDMAQMIPLLAKAKGNLSWFKPEVVIADKGYDGSANYNFIVNELGTIPIIAMAAKSKKPLPEVKGTPSNPCCIRNMSLIYRGRNDKKGKNYVCPMRSRGKCNCDVYEQCGLRSIWIKDEFDYRRFGFIIDRADEKWQEFYSKRTSIERINSRLKLTRRLEAHCFRGFNNINLHSSLSVLVMQATALAKMKSNTTDNIRECLRKVG